MRILSWNCRGASRAPTVRSIKALIKGEGPDVLFVSETKVYSPKMEKLKFKMGFANCFAINSRGRADGLALFWKMGVELEVMFSNKNIIAALIFSDPPENPWLLLAVYGPPYFVHKRSFWNLMSELIHSFSGTRLC